MKIRIFQGMDNAVFRVFVATEDWSEGDRDLINQFGEPEVNVGGEVEYYFNGETRVKTFGDMFVRVLHGFPYTRGFDARDYSEDREDESSSGSAEYLYSETSPYAEAVAVGRAWKDMVVSRIEYEVRKLREHTSPLPTEEVSEI